MFWIAWSKWGWKDHNFRHDNRYPYTQLDKSHKQLVFIGSISIYLYTYILLGSSAWVYASVHANFCAGDGYLEPSTLGAGDAGRPLAVQLFGLPTWGQIKASANFRFCLFLFSPIGAQLMLIWRRFKCFFPFFLNPSPPRVFHLGRRRKQLYNYDRVLEKQWLDSTLHFQHVFWQPPLLPKKICLCFECMLKHELIIIWFKFSHKFEVKCE